MYKPLDHICVFAVFNKKSTASPNLAPFTLSMGKPNAFANFRYWSASSESLYLVSSNVTFETSWTSLLRS
jgi:hypothetical protein